MKRATSPDYRHKVHPMRCAPHDFWGQVSRTVHGQPVSDDQIAMIVTAIQEGLVLASNDVLLDIGCGNGALANYFFPQISAYFGVDFSEYLVGVAKQNFATPDFDFQCLDAATYIATEPHPERFTKALCYGAFSYLSHDDAVGVLRGLSARFRRVSRVLIGNLPDRDLASQFYSSEMDYQALLDDRTAAIGVWRSRKEFQELAAESGWRIQFSTMPREFYSSHYRYDVLLQRIES